MNKVKPTISAIAIATQLILGSSAALAQAPVPAAQGPIDITANEQDFSGEQVIARGNVRVVYKESIILAPAAQLFRDATGNPARAIFTGHPRLSQGTNKIDAETLTFEIAQQKIIAVGNAHSEVEGEADAETPAPLGDAAVSGDAATAPKKADSAAKKGEKIITDADRQEYDQATGRFDAMGHVKVTHGDITVLADKLKLVYGINNKPETAVFTGHVQAQQNRNSTHADQMTYSLTTKRLQATGNVRSKVIQEKKETKKPAGPTAMDLLATPANAKTATEIAPTNLFELTSDGDPIYILSDAQDYSRDNGRVTARGNVKVVYGDTIGIGPQIVLTRNTLGQADKVYFTGRSQISQPGRRWIADAITFVVEEHRVVAHGNSRAMILQTPDKNKPGKTQPAPKAVPSNNTRMAEERRPI